MSFVFRDILPEDAAWANPLLMASGKNTCEYSFATAYMWSGFYGVRIAQTPTSPIFCSEHEGVRSYLVPVGERADDLLLQLREMEPTLHLHSVDEATLAHLKTLFPARVHAEEQPADFDYLYRTADLATLPGKPYHSKKNHISAFTRAHTWTYEPLTAANHDDVVHLSQEWCIERGGCDHSLSAEQCGIRRLLADADRLSVRGGLVRVEGKAVAFTLGSPINDRVFDIHVEKALSDFAGAYAVINREFAATLTEYEYLNRENDMGIEGLRRAKESYRPVEILKKYRCTIV